MTDRAPAPADVEAIAEVREQLAADLYTAVDWSGCDGSRWANVPTVHRRKWYALADAALTSPALATLRAHERAEAWDEALAAVTSGVRSAKDAHAEHGHRQIVSALAGLESAIPDTENPYRGGAA